MKAMKTQKSTKPKTNDQAFKSLIKDIEGSVYGALLRERILKIMEVTLQDIEEHPEHWNNAFIHSSIYIRLNEIVQEHLGFQD